MFFVGLVVNYDLFIFTDFLFFKQKTAYEMRISDWSSDVCSSDLLSTQHAEEVDHATLKEAVIEEIVKPVIPAAMISAETRYLINPTGRFVIGGPHGDCGLTGRKIIVDTRSEEHTSELQSLMRISYAVFCLKKNNNTNTTHKA